MPVGQSVRSPVGMREQLAIAQPSAFDLCPTGVGGHPNKVGDWHIVDVDEDLMVNPRQGSVGRARPSAPRMNGINAGSAITAKGGPRSCDCSGLQDRPRFSTGYVVAIVGCGAASNGHHVVMTFKYNHRPAEARGVWVQVVPTRAIGVDDSTDMPIEAILHLHPLEGAVRRRAGLGGEDEPVEREQTRGERVADLLRRLLSS